MIDSLQQFFEKHFGALLIASFALGFVVPGIDRIPAQVLVPVLAVALGREFILANWQAVPLAFLISATIYGLFYV